jgi:hypothetical protein
MALCLMPGFRIGLAPAAPPDAAAPEISRYIA